MPNDCNKNKIIIYYIERTPLLYLEVNLGSGELTKILIYEGDNES